MRDIGNTETESTNPYTDMLFNNPNFEPSYSMAELKVPSSHLRGGLSSERGASTADWLSRSGEIVHKKGEV